MTDYNAWTLAIARSLCTSDAPCDLCMAAAYRIVAHRRELRKALNDFALDEADLLVRCEIADEPSDVYALARTIGPVLKRLYPQNPDVVLGREARVIAEAIAPLVADVRGDADVMVDTGTQPERGAEA